MTDNIIGPIPIDDWYYMRMLKESIKHAKETNPEKYRLMINVHSNNYKEELRKIVSNG